MMRTVPTACVTAKYSEMRHGPSQPQSLVARWPHVGVYEDMRASAARLVPGSVARPVSGSPPLSSPEFGVMPSQLVAWAARAGEKRTVAVLRDVYDPPSSSCRSTVHPPWSNLQVLAPSSGAPGSLTQQSPARWGSNGAVRGVFDARSPEMRVSNHSGVPESWPTGLGGLPGGSPLVSPALHESTPLHAKSEAEHIPQSLPFRTFARNDPLTGSVNA